MMIAMNCVTLCIFFLTYLSSGDGQMISDEAALVSSVNKFNLNLLENLPNVTTNNQFISPFSLSVAFGILWCGSKGLTRTEICNVLQYPFSTPKATSVTSIKIEYQSAIALESNPINVTLNVANKIVVSTDNGFQIRRSYSNDLTKYFSASIDPVSFETQSDQAAVVNNVNSFVNTTTNGKISSVLTDQDVNQDTVLIIINVIYFKGLWKMPFNPNNTISGVFNRGSGEAMTTNMVNYMNLYNIKLNYARIDELSSFLFEVPYSGDQISMYILLPDDINGIETIFSDTAQINTLKSKLSNIPALNMIYNRTVNQLSMPKFKFELTYNPMNDILKNMGMNQVFDPSKSDLSGINVGGKVGDLYVSNVIHKTFIEVNEEGTEAAAVTVITIVSLALVEPMFNFILDHPYLFLIQDKRNGMTLFSGIVNQPDIVTD